MTCPKCGDRHAHRSHRAGIKDQLMHLFQMIPYRCKNCKSRYYAYRAGEKSSRMRTTEERKIMELRRRIKWKRSKRELAVYLVAILALIGIIYMTLQQRV